MRCTEKRNTLRGSGILIANQAFFKGSKRAYYYKGYKIASQQEFKRVGGLTNILLCYNDTTFLNTGGVYGDILYT